MSSFSVLPEPLNLLRVLTWKEDKLHKHARAHLQHIIHTDRQTNKHTEERGSTQPRSGSSDLKLLSLSLQQDWKA